MQMKANWNAVLKSGMSKPQDASLSWLTEQCDQVNSKLKVLEVFSKYLKVLNTIYTVRTLLIQWISQEKVQEFQLTFFPVMIIMGI